MLDVRAERCVPEIFRAASFVLCDRLLGFDRGTWGRYLEDVAPEDGFDIVAPLVLLQVNYEVLHRMIVERQSGIVSGGVLINEAEFA